MKEIIVRKPWNIIRLSKKKLLNVFQGALTNKRKLDDVAHGTSPSIRMNDNGCSKNICLPFMIKVVQLKVGWKVQKKELSSPPPPVYSDGISAEYLNCPKSYCRALNIILLLCFIPIINLNVIWLTIWHFLAHYYSIAL